LTGEQKQEVKRTARKLYRDGRISLEMAVWAMKNAGYTEKETAEWLKLKAENKDGGNNENRKIAGREGHASSPHRPGNSEISGISGFSRDRNA
jgi:hypothetical protein